MPANPASVVFHAVPSGSIIVDAGRFGWAHIAVPESGPYDRGSFDRASRLAGASTQAAGVEFIGGPLVFSTSRATTFAVAGVDTTIVVTINGSQRRHHSHTTISVHAGSQVTVHRPRSGLRGYLAFRGGLDMPAVLGSRSRDTLSNIGPVLSMNYPYPLGSAILSSAQIDCPLFLPSPVTRVEVELEPGPFGHPWRGLMQTQWVMSSHSDRVGMRLEGRPIDDPPDVSSTSKPMVRGAVQVPPDGLPVILGPDHPTTGGYPVVGVITPESSDRLAHAHPGCPVRFVPTTVG